MSTSETVGSGVAPPEPDLTPEEMVARAVALRPKLIADQEATEQRTYYSAEMHEAFLNAGFYHLYVPRRYGGYEFDVPTYVGVVQEIARGCVSTAWCMGLAMNHALMVGSWWPQEAQDEIFAGGDFRCASVAAPVGRAERTDAGWEINGQVAFASGSPYSTFYMGQAILPAPAGASPEDLPPQLLFVAPAQRVGDARRLGRHARSQGIGLAQHPVRRDPDPFELGVRGQHARHRRRRRHPRVAPARQPDVLGTGGVDLHAVARRRHRRGGLQHARRVRAADARAQDALAAVHPAGQGPGLSSAGTGGR